MNFLSRHYLILAPCFYFASCNQKGDVSVKEEAFKNSKSDDKLKTASLYTPRYEQIRDLYQSVENERRLSYQQGSFDGSGMLYQTMDSFNKLKAICTTEELMIIETLLGPPVSSRPNVFTKNLNKLNKNAEQGGTPNH